MNSPQVVPFFTSRSSQPLSILRRHKPSGSEIIPCNLETSASESASTPTSAPALAPTSALTSTPTSAPTLTTTGQKYVSAQKDKYTKMKLRKEAKKDRAERKAKTVITDGDHEDYDIDKVLRTLGEVSYKIESTFPIYQKCKPVFSFYRLKWSQIRNAPLSKVLIKRNLKRSNLMQNMIKILTLKPDLL